MGSQHPFFRLPMKTLGALALALCWAPAGAAQNSTEHILHLPGHTHSAQRDPRGDIVLTCDYKTLSGAYPAEGEPCGSEPRLYFSEQDLRDLKYVVRDEVSGEFIYENARIIERIYERFPGLLIVLSSDTSYDYSWIPELEERGQIVDVEHPVPEEVYRFYAERAAGFLDLATAAGLEQGLLGIVYGAFVNPYENSPFFGWDPVEMARLERMRPLPQLALALFPRNPSRSTLLHELLHYMIYRARQRAIAVPERLVEIGVQTALASYYYGQISRSLDQGLFPQPPVEDTEDLRRLYRVLYSQGATLAIDHAAAEEVEIRRFVSLYGEELGLMPSSLDAHRGSLCAYASLYQTSVGYLDHLTSELDPATTDYLPPLFLMPAKKWSFALQRARALALQYPRNLLHTLPQVERECGLCAERLGSLPPRSASESPPVKTWGSH